MIQPGMTFHARIAFANVHPEQARSVVAIGDTVIAKSEGTQVLEGYDRWGEKQFHTNDKRK